LPPLFFLTAPPTSGIYTLSLHDALPICVIADEIAGLTVFGGDFGEARAVGAFAVANDEDQVGLGREGTYGGLAVRCGVTDVGGGRSLNLWETLFECVDDFLAILDAEGGLRDVGDFVLVLDVKIGNFILGDHEPDVFGRPAHGADGL